MVDVLSFRSGTLDVRGILWLAHRCTEQEARKVICPAFDETGMDIESYVEEQHLEQGPRRFRVGVKFQLLEELEQVHKLAACLAAHPLVHPGAIECTLEEVLEITADARPRLFPASPRLDSSHGGKPTDVLLGSNDLPGFAFYLSSLGTSGGTSLQLNLGGYCVSCPLFLHDSDYLPEKNIIKGWLQAGIHTVFLVDRPDSAPRAGVRFLSIDDCTQAMEECFDPLAVGKGLNFLRGELAEGHWRPWIG